jgi:hypothetical protein
MDRDHVNPNDQNHEIFHNFIIISTISHQTHLGICTATVLTHTAPAHHEVQMTVVDFGAKLLARVDARHVLCCLLRVDGSLRSIKAGSSWLTQVHSRDQRTAGVVNLGACTRTQLGAIAEPKHANPIRISDVLQLFGKNIDKVLEVGDQNGKVAVVGVK